MSSLSKRVGCVNVCTCTRHRFFPVRAPKNAADSLYFLGLLKLYGISVSPDAAKALEYMRKAAELRHLDAMAALGVMLLHGRGDTAEL